MKKIISLVSIVFLLSGCNLGSKEESQPSQSEQVAELTKDLFTAIDKQNVAEVEKFVESGADLTMYDSQGKTPLIRAVQVGNGRIVEILILGGSLIFQPEETGGISAYALAEKDQGVVFESFKAERNNLLNRLEELLNNRDFDESLSFIESNFIPAELKLPSFNNYPFYLVATNDDTVTESGRKIVSHYLENLEDEVLSDFSMITRVIKYASGSKDQEYFKSVLSRLKFLDTHEIDNQNTYRVGKFFIQDSQPLNWFSRKLSILSELEIVPEPESFKNVAFHLMQQFNDMSREDINRVLDVFEQYFLAVVEDRSLVTSRIHSEYSTYIVDNFNNYREGLLVLIRLIEIMKINHDIEGVIFTGDLIGKVVEADLEFNYDLVDIKKLIDLEAGQNSDNRVFTVSGLQFLVTDYVKGQRRNEILSYILFRLREVPENLLELALMEDKEAFRMILNSEAGVNPFQQFRAAVAAIDYADTGDEAKIFLEELQSKGIEIQRPHFGQALKKSFERLWRGDDTFLSVIEYLYDNEEFLADLHYSHKTEILAGHNKYVRATKKHWILLHDLVSSFSTSSGQIDESLLEDEQKSLAKQFLYDSSVSIAGQQIDINISAPMDTVITLFEVYTNNISQIAPVRSVLAKNFEVFNQSYHSMDYADQELDAKNLVTHQIFPLAYLFSIEGEQILSRPDNYTEWKNWVEEKFILSKKASSPVINWQDFVVSSIFLYYSRQKDFWDSVIKEYLKSNMQVFRGNSGNTDDFLKVFIKSGGLEQYPELANFTHSFSEEGNQSNNYCVYPGSEYEIQTPVPVGSFEVLMPLYDKRCYKKEKLTANERRFVLSFIRANFGEEKRPLELLEYSTQTATQVVTDYYRPIVDGYAPPYNEFGSAKRYDESFINNSDLTSLIPEYLVSEDVVFIEPTEYQMYFSKLKFIRHFYQCADHASDSETYSMISEYYPEHDFFHAAAEKLTVCRQSE
ncbi:MAG: hypothetical protein HRT44_01445 [Bdellovibrionales bacterium]|nr:hypothetical protein [Bdellovibrionales bacterium]NQZ17911.1 hypothetical protein [Bdellovibrionales bacterium]